MTDNAIHKSPQIFLGETATPHEPPHVTSKEESGIVGDEETAEQAHRDRLTSLGELAACLAHELNQPLCAVLANAAAALNLLQSGPVSLPALEAMRCVTEQAQRASEILHRIRDFACRNAPLRKPIPVERCIAEAVALMKSHAKSLGVTVDLRFDSDLPCVVIDPIQIEQVVVNLVRNGLEAMGDTPQTKRALIVRAYPKNDDVCVSVEDRGAGLPEEAQKHIFEKFYTTKPDDLGLGLSISRAIVLAHGGRMWFEQNRGRGATFYFTLPTGMKGAPNGGSADSSHRG